MTEYTDQEWAVPGRTWSTERGEDLVLEPAEDADRDIWMWVNGRADAVHLSPAVAREVAAELVRRADLLDGNSTDK